MVHLDWSNGGLEKKLTDIPSPVQVCYGDDLSPHVVVESVDVGGVDEAVSHPRTGTHHFGNLTKNITFQIYLATIIS